MPGTYTTCGAIAKHDVVGSTVDSLCWLTFVYALKHYKLHDACNLPKYDICSRPVTCYSYTIIL